MIKEEDEDVKKFDDEFRKVLKIKSSYVIWNDDEEADKPYIPQDVDGKHLVQVEDTKKR